MKNIQLGMPVLLEFDDLLSNIKLCQSLNLNFIELNPHLPQYLPDNIAPDVLKRITERTGLEFTFHMPEELDIANFRSSARKADIEFCYKTIDWAKKAGIKSITMHQPLGVYFTSPQGQMWIYEIHFDDYISRLAGAVKNISEYSNENGIKFCLENTYPYTFPLVSRAVKYLEKIKSLYFTWDVGHDAKGGFTWENFFDENQDRIAHIHLHDFDGKSDHQVLFTGNVNIETVLEFAEERKIPTVIEVKTAVSLKESVKRVLMYYIKKRKSF